MRIAGIDIGTNTVRGVLLEKKGGVWDCILYLREITRLGERLEETGKISPIALERTIAGLTRVKKRLLDEGAEKIAAGATYSLRRAENRDAVIAKIAEQLNLKVKIIPPDEEARLALRGIFLNLPEPEEPALCIDIGGGSTELVITGHGGEITCAHSFPVGLVSFAERYVSDPVDQLKILAMRREMKEILLDGVPRHLETGLLYGNCGTFSTLAMMSMNMKYYNRNRLHGALIERSEFNMLKNAVIKSSAEERLKMPGVEKGREDLIVAGVCLVDVIFEMTGASSLVNSETGWLEAFTVEGLEG